MAISHLDQSNITLEICLYACVQMRLISRIAFAPVQMGESCPQAPWQHMATAIPPGALPVWLLQFLRRLTKVAMESVVVFR
jgi:hypothetical protein